MPAKNPRVNVVLERPLYVSVVRSAKRDGVSVSTKVRDLVREAVETSEDFMLVTIASAREAGFNWQNGLAHEHVFPRTRKAKK